jgi:hypothetical protein
LTTVPEIPGHERLARVRPGNETLDRLIERGRSESPTFQRLIGALESADWLIFVQPGLCPDRTMVGCLVHTVGRFGGRPYLRLLVTPAGRHPDVVIATLAHELQHAFEVVSDGTVTDQRSLIDLTRRIATSRFRTSKATIYETAAARRVQEAVLQELSSRQRSRTE